MVDGEEAQIVEAFARSLDNIAGKVIGKDERKNSSIEVEGLKRGLAKRKGRWLACLDTTDSRSINGLLRAVYSVTGLSDKCENGWILVTPRRGQPRLWNKIARDQRLLQGCLSEEDTMIVLWRLVRVIGTDKADDQAVRVKIEKLKEKSWDEYSAMKELCSRNGAHSLGGLLRALVQAGT